MLHRWWLVLLLIVGACASPPKPLETEITIEKSFSELAALYERQIRKCWKKEATPFDAGIAVTARSSGNQGAIFTATRQGLVGNAITGTTLKYDPFVSVELVSIAKGATLVKIKESKYCPSFESCVDLKFRTDLQDWAQGNIECKNTTSETK